MAFSVSRPPGHHAVGTSRRGFLPAQQRRDRRGGPAQAPASRSGSRSSTGTCTTATGPRRSSTTTQSCCTRRRTSARSTREAAPPSNGVAVPAVGTKHNLTLSPGAGDEAFVAAWHELLGRVREFPSRGHPRLGRIRRAPRRSAREPRDSPSRATGRSRWRWGRSTAELGLPGVALVLEGGYDLDALRAVGRRDHRRAFRGARIGPPNAHDELLTHRLEFGKTIERRYTRPRSSSGRRAGDERGQKLRHDHQQIGAQVRATAVFTSQRPPLGPRPRRTSLHAQPSAHNRGASSS